MLVAGALLLLLGAPDGNARALAEKCGIPADRFQMTYAGDRWIAAHDGTLTPGQMACARQWGADRDKVGSISVEALRIPESVRRPRSDNRDW